MIFSTPVCGRWSSDMVVRPLQSKDILHCADIMLRNPLWQRYQVTLESARHRLETGFNNQASIFVAEVENKVTGFIWFVEKGTFSRSGYIMLIAVDPNLHHSGVGQALMAHAEGLMFQTSKDIFLLVSDFNLSAQTFYSRLGYAQCGAIPDYVMPGISELIFRKSRPAFVE